MIRHKAVGGGVLALVLVMLALAGAPRGAWADGCTDLGGVPSGAPGTGECLVSGPVKIVNPTSAFNIDRSLRITTGVDASHDVAGDAGLVINVCVAPAPVFTTCDLLIDSGGSIDASDDAGAASPGSPNETGDSAKSITLNVARDVIMASGTSITAENRTGGGNGGNITIAAGRNVSLNNNAGVAPGATISSSRTAGGGSGTRAGDIRITAGPPPQSPVGEVFIQEFSVVKANTNNALAGRIDIIAGHRITVDGQVLSEGDLGLSSTTGGPIFLITCFLEVGDQGKVSSLGADPGPDLVHLEGCSVIIEGLVQSIGEAHGSGDGKLCKEAPRGPAHVQGNRPGFDNWTACVEIWSGTTVVIDGLNANGQVSADTALDGGAAGGGWIDIIARGAISILGPDSGPFAVHANQDVGGNSRHGGLVQVTSLAGAVSATGNAVQADATPAGSNGGEIIIHALTSVSLTGANVFARGDNVATGGFGNGGDIFVQAFTGAVNWTSGTGNVLPTGSNVDEPNDLKDGFIDLTACTAVNQGATFPTNGAPDAGFPGVTTGTCGGAPTVPAYLTDGLEQDLPPADCVQRCGEGPPGGGGGECNKSSIRSILDRVSGRFPDNNGPDRVIKVHPPTNELIQPFVDAAADLNGDGYIILLVVAKDGGLLGGHTSQHVSIANAYPDPFGLLACSVTLHAVTPAQPTGHILPSADAPEPSGGPGNIFVMDLHAADSAVAGWLVEGDGRYLRNVYALDNTTVGTKLDGDSNTVHNGQAIGNHGIGILVEGSGNLVTGAKVLSNHGHGISVAGTGNTVEKADVGDKGKGNTGDGVHVEGLANTVSETDAHGNFGHGIFVRGDGNQVKKNNAGEKNKGNILDGIHVGGNGNVVTENDAFANLQHGFNVLGTGNFLKSNRAGDTGKGNIGDGFHIEGSQNVLDSNRANANTGDGFDFARAAGTSNVLKANKSNEGGATKENQGCEYRFAESTTVDAGGNKEDNANFPGVAGKYPAQCKE